MIIVVIQIRAHAVVVRATIIHRCYASKFSDYIFKRNEAMYGGIG